MNYLLKSKTKHETRNRLFIAIFIFLVFYLIGYFFSDTSRSVVYSISRPMWVTENILTAPFRGIIGFFKTKNNLINQNLALQDEISSLKLRDIDYEIILKENQDLKNEIGRHNIKNPVYSRVLSRPPRSPYDTFVVDVGSVHGVTPADRVYLSDNVIIGLVTTVTQNTSLVQLFSSSGNKQEAIVSRTGASFVLEGMGGANFKLEVPKDTDIIWGDVFLYPGINSSVIATVYYIDSNSQSSFKSIYLRIPGNAFQTKSVFIDSSIR